MRKYLIKGAKLNIINGLKPGLEISHVFKSDPSLWLYNEWTEDYKRRQGYA